MNLLDAAYTWNLTVFIFEILALIISFILIFIGLLQNKKAQTGLSALNGGNDELFLNTKERGLDKTFSIVMVYAGIALFLVTTVIVIITNVHLK